MAALRASQWWRIDLEGSARVFLVGNQLYLVTVIEARARISQVQTVATHRALSSRDSSQHRQRWKDVRGVRRKAVARSPAGISARRLLLAPRRTRLLAASRVGGRRRLERLDREASRSTALVLYEDGRAQLRRGTI